MSSHGVTCPPLSPRNRRNLKALAVDALPTPSKPTAASFGAAAFGSASSFSNREPSRKRLEQMERDARRVQGLRPPKVRPPLVCTWTHALCTCTSAQYAPLPTPTPKPAHTCLSPPAPLPRLSPNDRIHLVQSRLVVSLPSCMKRSARCHVPPSLHRSRPTHTRPSRRPAPTARPSPPTAVGRAPPCRVSVGPSHVDRSHVTSYCGDRCPRRDYTCNSHPHPKPQHCVALRSIQPQ